MRYGFVRLLPNRNAPYETHEPQSAAHCAINDYQTLKPHRTAPWDSMRDSPSNKKGTVKSLDKTASRPRLGPLEAPPEGRPQDPVEGAAGGKLYGVWLHFTYKTKQKIIDGKWLRFDHSYYMTCYIMSCTWYDGSRCFLRCVSACDIIIQRKTFRARSLVIGRFYRLEFYIGRKSLIPAIRGSLTCFVCFVVPVQLQSTFVCLVHRRQYVSFKIIQNCALFFL